MFNKIKVDNNFLKFISSTRGISRVSDILAYDDFVKPFGDFLMVDPKEFDTVSYIPKSKVSISDGFKDEKYRTKIKIGRFVSKIIPENIYIRYDVRPSEVEKFVNLFKSYFDIDSSKFRVISGPEILHWYLDVNYHKPADKCIGPLWNSCMRYWDRNEFMKIYSDNPDKIKMLINVDNDGKLRTRALLWEDCVCEDGKSVKVMDRIYSTYDHEVDSFKKWAIDNGYLHKLDQSSKSDYYFVGGSGLIGLNLKVKLENHSFVSYPYMDTFKFFNRKGGVLRNWNHSKMNFILTQVNGTINRGRDEYDEDDGWDEIDNVDDNNLDDGFLYAPPPRVQPVNPLAAQRAPEDLLARIIADSYVGIVGPDNDLVF